jgi:6-phosphogluconate dehydrogenase (decarboxylating)
MSKGARLHERTEITVGVVGCGRMGCAIAGEFVRRGCTVVLYDHTEYTRNRAFQTLRASLWDHVRLVLPKLGLRTSDFCALCWHQVSSGYLLKQDVDELMGRISVSATLAETLMKSEVSVYASAMSSGLTVRRPPSRAHIGATAGRGRVRLRRLDPKEGPIQ